MNENNELAPLTENWSSSSCSGPQCVSSHVEEAPLAWIGILHSIAGDEFSSSSV